jgi:hypothetical protein
MVIPVYPSAAAKQELMISTRDIASKRFRDRSPH